MDISNGLGCITFILVFIIIAFICWYSRKNSGRHLYIADSIILIASVWFNGMRKKGHQAILYIKTDIVVELEMYFETIKKTGENYVPSMALAKDKEGKEFPTDCRFNIVFDNAPADFYGIQAQININSVNSTNYPYFYCVITAKKDFGLDKYEKRLVIPKGITIQFSVDKMLKLLLFVSAQPEIRVPYKTDARKTILEFSLNLQELLLRITSNYLSGLKRSSTRLNSREDIMPNKNIIITRASAGMNVSPDSSKPASVNPGATTVGKIARDEPNTVPRIIWYIISYFLSKSTLTSLAKAMIASNTPIINGIITEKSRFEIPSDILLYIPK